MTDPNTCLTYPDGNPNGNGYCSRGDINVSIPINFFDENTHFVDVINDYFDSKCFWWRIVIEGNDCEAASGAPTVCVTKTDWEFFEII